MTHDTTQGHFTLNCCPDTGNSGLNLGRPIRGDLEGGRIVSVSQDAPEPLKARLMHSTLAGLIQLAERNRWRVEVSFESATLDSPK